MHSSLASVRELSKTGMRALRAGDAQAARVAFEQVVATGLADASVWLALAYACRGLKDGDATRTAVEKALALEPHNLRALILNADCLAASGDARGANSFYRAALQTASTNLAAADGLEGDLARAQAACDHYAAKFNDHLWAQLTAQGLDDSPTTRRFRQSLDMLAGRKARYVQEPLNYFFPELAPIQFFERADFPWLDHIEAETASIREELLGILRTDAAFEPYVQPSQNRPYNAQAGLLNNPDWSAFYLWKNGEVVRENAARCPRTMAALAHVPFTPINSRSPSVLFSLLRPGAHIPAHTGFVNTRLICHLPLIVSEGCQFRVGNETRPWVEGKAWVFDDTIEHEAWNHSKETRVILLFEIWRPELTMEERRLVSAMFSAIDAHEGKKTTWDI
ncbi:MAG: aspartyl/asparaginyl beta-hydroxylase domain-containing protein [Usitatibacteraceae bacterium]